MYLVTVADGGLRLGPGERVGTVLDVPLTRVSGPCAGPRRQRGARGRRLPVAPQLQHPPAGPERSGAPGAWSTPLVDDDAATVSCGRSDEDARDRRRHLLHPRTLTARTTSLPATRRRVQQRDHLALHLQPRRRRATQGAVRLRRPCRGDGRALPGDGAQRRRPGRLPRHRADPVPSGAPCRPPLGDGVRRRLRGPLGRPVRSVRPQRGRPPHHDPHVSRPEPRLAALGRRRWHPPGSPRTGWCAHCTH